MDERILKAILQFGLDKQSLEQVRQGTKSVEDGLKEVQKQADAAMKKYAGWQAQAEKLQRVGLTTGAIGAGIAAPFVAAMASYVTAAGKSEQSSRRWLAANDRIAQSTQRIGKVALEGVLPVIEKVAGLAEKAAAFAEKNPDAVKGILGVAGALVGVGGLATIAAQGIKLVYDVKSIQATATQLVAAKIMDGAANKQLGAANAGGNGGLLGKLGGGALGGFLKVAGAGVGGMFAGSEISKMLGNMGLDEFLGKSASIIAGGLVRLITGDVAKGQEAFQRTAVALGQLGDTAEETATKLGLTDEQMLSFSKSFMQYQKQEAEAQAQYEKEKAQTIKDYQDQSAEREANFRNDQASAEKSYLKERQQAEADYQAESSRALRDYATQVRQSEEDYYLERSKAARDYNTQVQRAEEDFQRDQARKREDFNASVEDLLGEGDAIGYEKALRAYELDRQRSQEDYGIKSGRDSQDFNTQQADREAEFAKERERKAQEFIQQQADRAVQFEQERVAKAAEFIQQQADRQKAFEQEQLKAKGEFDQRMNALDSQFATERTKRYNALVDMFMDELGLIDWKHQAEMAGLQGMITAIQNAMPGAATVTQPVKGSRASGGYVSTGPWMMHNDEFVMSKRTTRAAEVAAGRRLDQQSMMRMLAGGGNVTWNDHRRFDSDLSVAQRREINRDTDERLMGALNG